MNTLTDWRVFRTIALTSSEEPTTLKSHDFNRQMIQSVDCSVVDHLAALSAGTFLPAVVYDTCHTGGHVCIGWTHDLQCNKEQGESRAKNSSKAGPRTSDVREQTDADRRQSCYLVGCVRVATKGMAMCAPSEPLLLASHGARGTTQAQQTRKRADTPSAVRPATSGAVAMLGSMTLLPWRQVTAAI